MEKYKLRKVVKQYVSPGVVLKDVQVRYELLECGHSVRYQEPRSTAEKIRQASGPVRRCYQCSRLTQRALDEAKAQHKLGGLTVEISPDDGAGNPTPRK